MRRACAPPRIASRCLIERRSFSWKALSPSNWNPQRITNPEVEQVLPEVFAAQPDEVGDYIRPEKTLFERVEDGWDWVISFVSPVEKTMDGMRGLHNGAIFGIDLSWGGALLVWGILLRVLSLIPQLYAHRNSLRLAQIAPELGELNQMEKKVKQDRSLGSPEKRVIKEGYARKKAALYKKHRCSQTLQWIQASGTPFMIFSLMAVRRLAEFEPELHTATFFWITNLASPDPTWLLPIICNTLFLCNFELTRRMSHAGRSSNSMYMRWIVRVGCVGATYFFHTQPSAVFLYWAGLSLGGIVQPTLLRSKKFRAWFDLLPPPSTYKIQPLQRLRNRVLSALGKLNPTPENEAALKKAVFEKIQDFDVIFSEDEKRALKRGASPTR